MRKYKSGTKWCLWRWTNVCTEYITRLHLIKTPWFAVCMHWINHADPDPHLHDHPVTFFSVVLWGWYKDQTPNGLRMNRWWNFIRAADRHRIMAAWPGTITLCFMGPKVQEWGFYVDGKKVIWKDYYARANGGFIP